MENLLKSLASDFLSFPPMAHIDLNAPFVSQPAGDNNSLRTFIYLTDDGKALPVRLNENYAEALGFLSYTGPIPAADRAPDYLRFELRKIHASSVDGKVKQSFAVGSPDADIYVEGGTLLVPRKGKTGGLTLYVTGSTGERKTFPTTGDTGQISGDNP